jgi:hypothetical protein
MQYVDEGDSLTGLNPEKTVTAGSSRLLEPKEGLIIWSTRTFMLAKPRKPWFRQKQDTNI